MVSSNKNEVVIYTGAYLVYEDRVVKEDLWVCNGKFIDPTTVNYNADKVVAVHNKLITPGFIDLKLNGCFGVDFSSPKCLVSEKLSECRRSLCRYGVTSFMPCVTTSTADAYREILPLLSEMKRQTTSGAQVLGLHLDGPVHSKMKGHVDAGSPMSARAEKITSCTDLENLYGSFDDIKVISCAPELPGVKGNIIPGLTAMGIKVSLGHTVCSIEDAEQAVKAGASLIGHLFNGMPNFHHRDPSLVGLLASTEVEGYPVYFGLIADLIHTHPNSLAMAHKLHPTTLMLVSDAVSALGFDLDADKENETCITNDVGMTLKLRRTGSFKMCDDDLRSPIAAYDPGTNRLIGSCTSLNIGIKNMLNYTDCNLLEAIAAVTIRPAKAMDISDRKGSLHFGCDADFVTLDSGLNVATTYSMGELMYKRPQDLPDDYITLKHPIIMESLLR